MRFEWHKQRQLPGADRADCGVMTSGFRYDLRRPRSVYYNIRYIMRSSFIPGSSEKIWLCAFCNLIPFNVQSAANPPAASSARAKPALSFAGALCFP
jgi:hypothetical protein